MDEIMRGIPADAGAVRPAGGRSKGPAGFDRSEHRDAGAPVGDGGRPEGLGPLTAGRKPGREASDGPEGPPRQPAAGDERQQDAEDAGISAEEAAAALAAADSIEIEDEGDEAQADAEGLPPVPDLAGPEAIARMVFVLVLTQREGVSMLRLAQACNTTQKLVEEALEPLRTWLRQLDLPVEIARTGDTIRLLSSAEAFPYLQRLRGVKKLEKLSPAALETLAVIAYRQPVIRAEIEAIRGVKAGPMLRMLLQHKLARVTGRADVPGRPLQYGTTQHFLERFGLASLQELPSIREFKQLG